VGARHVPGDRADRHGAELPSRQHRRLATNQRLYEVTGVGSVLVTDWKSNMPDLFDLDREVVC
jgi:hypothetical protein